jgi:hypothetical protein
MKTERQEQRRMKPRLFWILASVVVLAAAASVLLAVGCPSLWSPGLVIKERGLRDGEAISVRTRAERFGVQKGDAFGYVLEVWYDAEKIAEIDRASLDHALNLDPFEIRGGREVAFDLDGGTKVIRKEYEIQLIAGKVNYLYRFPTAIIRYRPKQSEGLFDKKITPESIYVSSRLPDRLGDLELGYGPLRPVKGIIEGRGENRLPLILWVVGGLLGAVVVADVSLRVISHRKRRSRQGRKVDVLPQAYRSLCEHAAGPGDPRRLLHRMDHLLRVVAARKESGDWLDEPSFDLVSSGIREAVISLFQKCQKAYDLEAVEQSDAQELLRELDKILVFQFGKKQVDAWRK